MYDWDEAILTANDVARSLKRFAYAFVDYTDAPADEPYKVGPALTVVRYQETKPGQIEVFYTAEPPGFELLRKRAVDAISALFSTGMLEEDVRTLVAQVAQDVRDDRLRALSDPQPILEGNE